MFLNFYLFIMCKNILLHNYIRLCVKMNKKYNFKKKLISEY